MDPAELAELLTPEGLRLLDSLPPHESSHDVVASVARLRAAGHSPLLVAAVLTQAKLRARAVTKFGLFADRMLFTEAGLEQATRLSVAAHHAGRFRDAGLSNVVDLGCGIGADSLALAAVDVTVTAVERDEATAALAAYNLAVWPTASVVHASAEDVEFEGFDAAWLDPARRSEKGRLRDPGDWSPSLDFAFGLAERMPVGIKLGPGIDRELVPAEAEAQWVSVDGSVVELGLWFGALARPGIRRSALLLRDGTAHELTAAADSPDAAVGELGRYLYEPDGAVIRARLIGDLARTIDASMVSPDIAWLTSDAAVDTPFAQRFEVVEQLPLDVKRIKRALSERGIGTLEIKKRGVDIDPAEFRKKLALKGSETASLILTRVAGRRLALLARRA